MVSVAADRSRGAHLSIVAHELRHALEVASAPSVVDSESMGRYDDDVGFKVPGPPHLRRYDTRAAVDTGRRVFDEVLAHATAAERAEWLEWVAAPSISNRQSSIANEVTPWTWISSYVACGRSSRKCRACV